MIEDNSQAFEPRFRQLGKYVFQVRSRRERGPYYTVDALHLSCTCKAGFYGIRCWHLAWAIQQQYWQAEAERRAPKRRRGRKRGAAGTRGASASHVA